MNRKLKIPFNKSTLAITLAIMFAVSGIVGYALSSDTSISSTEITINDGTNDVFIADDSGNLNMTGNLKVADGSKLLSGSGGIPTIATFTYPATLSWNTTWTQAMGATTVTTLTDSALTSGRVTFASTSGLLADDADMIFSTDTLTVTKLGAFQATGAIDFNTQAMTNVDVNSGTVGGVTLDGTIGGTPTWSSAQTFAGVTSTGNFINEAANPSLTYNNSTSNNKAQIIFVTGDEALEIKTIDLAGTAQILRWKLDTLKDTAVSTWSATTHTGLVLSGTLEASGQNIDMSNGGLVGVGAITAEQGVDLQLIGATNAGVVLRGNREGGGGSVDMYTAGAPAGYTDTLRLSLTGGAATTEIAMTNANFNINGNNIITASNNTGTLFADATRVAQIWAVDVNYKTLTAGEIYESGYTQRATETYYFGQAVKSYGDGEHYTTTTQYGEPALGVVGKNPTQVIKSYTTTSEQVEVANKQSMITTTDLQDVTIDGVTYTTKVTDSYQETTTVPTTVTLTLADGSKKVVTTTKEAPLYIDAVTGQKTTNPTTIKSQNKSTPVYGSEGTLGPLGVGGKHQVKVGSPVQNNDLLIAGPNGLLYPLRSVPNVDGAPTYPIEMAIGASTHTIYIKMPSIIAIATEPETVIGDDADLVLALILR